jgi:hypothetical protein
MMKKEVRAIYGSHKIDDKTISYFAQKELYLAESSNNLKS